jgi:hypothetical protein
MNDISSTLMNGGFIGWMGKDLEVGRTNACSLCLWMFVVVAVG